MRNTELTHAKLLPAEMVLAESRWSGLLRQLTATRIDLSASGFAKRIVYRLLSAMQRGHLSVQDGADLFVNRALQGGDENSDENIVARIEVHDQRTYSLIAHNGVLGAAEAYMAGYWSSPDLLAVVRFMVGNMQELQAMNRQKAWLSKLALQLLRWTGRNSLSGSRVNIASHYDLGNDFFSLFLDSEMMYSAALFEKDHYTLEQASVAKLERICQKLELKPQDHLLEIGTGWGGMAIYAAQKFGCKVTTTTISQQQYQYTRQRVEALGLSERITVLCKDYRELSGRYDKLVSIEMIEAVGSEFYQTYFEQCSRLLAQDGLMLIQAITIPDQRYQQASRSVDFIKRYIFPGGCLPSHSVIGQHVAKHTDMNLLDVLDMTGDYAKTLHCWNEAFGQKIDGLLSMGFDQHFIKMWEYYLCYCEGGFRERAIGTSQILLAKPDYRQC